MYQSINSIAVKAFSLTVEGFSFTYTLNGVQKSFSYDPLATCDLFQKVGLIECFDRDYNGEPVILYTDDQYGRPATGHCLWCDYVRTFGFIQRHAEIIAEYREDERRARKIEAQINYLLHPLKATA